MSPDAVFRSGSDVRTTHPVDAGPRPPVCHAARQSKTPSQQPLPTTMTEPWGTPRRDPKTGKEIKATRLFGVRPIASHIRNRTLACRKGDRTTQRPPCEPEGQGDRDPVACPRSRRTSMPHPVRLIFFAADSHSARHWVNAVADTALISATQMGCPNSCEQDRRRRPVPFGLPARDNGARLLLVQRPNQVNPSKHAIAIAPEHERPAARYVGEHPQSALSPSTESLRHRPRPASC